MRKAAKCPLCYSMVAARELRLVQIQRVKAPTVGPQSEATLYLPFARANYAISVHVEEHLHQLKECLAVSVLLCSQQQSPFHGHSKSYPRG